MEETYKELKAQWLAGDRDRERNLNLMFLAWYHWAEPSFLTDFEEDSQAVGLWKSIFAHFGGDSSNDIEFLFAAGIMVNIASYMLGDEDEWMQRGKAMIRQAMSVQEEALPLSTFDNRGDYGDYFAHQLRGHLRRG
ncbi:hypothetical protein [Parasphingopyxis sp.]|uniref:hypothetical protein n=1 Tax=Parasphingopyxis sp. TaxID=1920299 RepID=UPI00261FE82A|nr:hypothetical protein [Parasphingopyxis sp.]